METATLLQSQWGGTSQLWHSSSYDGANWFISNFQGLQFDSGYGENRIDGKYNDPYLHNLDLALWGRHIKKPASDSGLFLLQLKQPSFPEALPGTLP